MKILLMFAVLALGAAALAQPTPVSKPQLFAKPGITATPVASSSGVNATLSTNAPAPPVVVVQPTVERVESWLKVAEDFLAGALAVIVALLGVWGKLKSKRAAESEAITGVLIQEIQKIATKEIKDDISSAARDAGVSDSLHAAVKANTASTPAVTTPVPPTPVNPTPVQP